jgi:hypothetical protein
MAKPYETRGGGAKSSGRGGASYRGHSQFVDGETGYSYARQVGGISAVSRGVVSFD